MVGSASGQNGDMEHWEYLLMALPAFEAPTASPESSAAVHALNREGANGWEAGGMTGLADGSVAVLFKKPVQQPAEEAFKRL